MLQIQITNNIISFFVYYNFIIIYYIIICVIQRYKLSTRPVYREKQKIFTALLWRCCPGHGGENCEDIGTKESYEKHRF